MEKKEDMNQEHGIERISSMKKEGRSKEKREGKHFDVQINYIKHLLNSTLDLPFRRDTTTDGNVTKRLSFQQLFSKLY